MLKAPIRTTQDFLLSNYFSDGLRITFGILLPSLVLAQFGLLSLGLTLSLGALCVSVVDFPGPLVHRRNAMLVTVAFTSFTSLIIGLTNANSYVTAVLLVVFCIFFSMMSVYGPRETSIGTATLLVLVLSIDDVRSADVVFLHAGLVLCGGLWYTAMSYFFTKIRPYRIVQLTLSDSIVEVSEFLDTKARFYKENTDYEENYTELLKLQAKVNEQQEAVREVLFKTREIVRESTPEGRFLLLVFVDMVDLFEQIMSTFYNYEQLHQQFDSIGILTNYEKAIHLTAEHLRALAFSLKSGGQPPVPKELNDHVHSLKQDITFLEQNNKGRFKTSGIIALKNIEVNIENIVNRINIITKYFKQSEKKNLRKPRLDTEKFISRQSIDLKLFLDNFTLKSNTFRHSLRVAIVMLIGYLVAGLLKGSHSYWILLTILVISKPAFSLTKERNYSRIIGTIVGAVIGILIVTFVHDKNFLFVILLFTMIGAYSFQRKNYVVSVLFTTPYILVLFNFLGMGTISVAQERILDTLIGSGIAFTASYFLFPSWEHEKVKEAMIKMLQANKDYLKQVTDLLFNNPENTTKYKVARKDVYVATANLATLFQRMFSEPKSKQIIIKELYQFTALNHLLSSNIATLTSNYANASFRLEDQEDFKALIGNTVYLLQNSEKNLNEPTSDYASVPLVKLKPNALLSENEDYELIRMQFNNIQKVAYDVNKLTEKIKA